MKLDRLRMLLIELETEFSPESVSSSIFYKHNNTWHGLDDPTSVQPVVINSLVKAETADQGIHHVSSLQTAWFVCSRTSCIVSLKFLTSPQAAKRRKAKQRLDQVISRAINAYKVAHNPLTLLLAREEFNDRLRRSIESLEKSELSGTAVEESVPPTLGLLALDIDHFKQVNDNYGHLYGDQVLKTFARRLEDATQKIEENENNEVQFELGHPSGEEFLISVKGKFTEKIIIEWCDEIRSKISDIHLPSETEWKWLTEIDNLSAVVLPAIQERSVSASIGVAFHTQLVATESKEDQITRLLKQADTALYRAKASGRNKVISFDAIMTNCGRVLEQDQSTGVIALDIGKNVGVSIGQEFKVFTPSYSGAKKFTINDGRTVRTLGEYPKVELTRITVFNAQPELSFAFITDSNDLKIGVEAGCHIEAVPLGSIGHALPHFAKYFNTSMGGVKVGDISSLHEFVETATKVNQTPFAVVFRFSRSVEYLKRYGSAALNECLTRLYRVVSATFTIPSITGVLDTSTICVVGKKSGYVEKTISALVPKLRDDYPELGVVVGACTDSDFKNKSDEKAASDLDTAFVIEYARFAASDHAVEQDVFVSHFNHKLANNILIRQREIRAYDSAATDYEKLIAIGVSSATLSNLGGLIYMTNNGPKRASELFMQAVQSSPNEIVFKSNYAVACSVLGDEYSFKALDILNELAIEQVELLEKSHPLGFVTYARLLARAKLAKSQSFNRDRFVFIANRSLGMEAYKNSRQSRVIEEALLAQ